MDGKKRKAKEDKNGTKKFGYIDSRKTRIAFFIFGTKRVDLISFHLCMKDCI